MKFTPTRIPGVLLIEPTPIADDRGYFARTFCEEELAAQGVKFHVSQANISFNKRAGTVRGMHFQAAPHEEPKIVRVSAGAIVDVALDLRPDSPTFREHVSYELSAGDHRMLYIAPGLAHGFQTLRDETVVEYLMGAPFVAGAGRGVRWNDPAFKLSWPLPISVISPKDLAYPDFTAGDR